MRVMEENLASHDIDHLVINADGLLNKSDDGQQEALAQRRGGNLGAKNKALHDQNGLQNLEELAQQREPGQRIREYNGNALSHTAPWPATR